MTFTKWQIPPVPTALLSSTALHSLYKGGSCRSLLSTRSLILLLVCKVLIVGVHGFLLLSRQHYPVMTPKDESLQQQQQKQQRQRQYYGPCVAKRRRMTTSFPQDTKPQPWRLRVASSTTTSLLATSDISVPALPPPSPLSPRRFTFGVMADIQYAPIPDGFSYAGVPRYYRHSLEVTKHAARHFQEEKVPLVINLGDIIDGKCQDVAHLNNGGEADPIEPASLATPDNSNDNNSLKKTLKPGIQAIDQVLDALSAYSHGQIIHTYGNHELYNLDRPALATKLGIPFVQEPCGDLVGYHSYLHDNIRFVVLDTYDIAKLQRCRKTSTKYREACDILQRHNPNYPRAENSPSGMQGLNRRFVAFNGAVGPIQLAWLRETLNTARTQREMVVLLSHQPILPGSASPVCLVWNYEDVLNVIRDFPDVIIASLAGHAHKGGYKRDGDSGIHFRVIEAVLENPAPRKTYAMIDVHDDRLVLRGYGNCTSTVFDFDHMVVTPQQQQQQNDNVSPKSNTTAVALK